MPLFAIHFAVPTWEVYNSSNGPSADSRGHHQAQAQPFVKAAPWPKKHTVFFVA